MGNWHITIPEERANLVRNPSPQRSTTGYSAISGASISQSVDRQRRGAYALAVELGSDGASGVYYGTVGLVSDEEYVLSVDVWAPDGLPLTLYIATTGGSQVGDALSFDGTGDWQRVALPHVSPATADRRVYLTKAGGGATDTIYLDGLQVEAGAYPTTYIDGAQPGCRWLGQPYGSTSQRSSQSRAGGRVVDLEDLGIIVQRQQGTGMPPVENTALDSATLDGALYQDTRVLPRPFALTFWVTAEAEGFRGLHALRAAAIALLRPDVSAVPQPVQLRYYGVAATAAYGAPSERVLSGVYEDGLRLEATKGYTETITVRLLGHDPYVYDGAVVAHALNAQQEIGGVNGIVVRDDGIWRPLGSGILLGAGITGRSLIWGPDNKLYAGGSFTSPGTRVARYNFDTDAWETLGSGLPASPRALAFGPDGRLYAGGLFTISSVTSGVAVYDEGSSTWACVGNSATVAQDIGWDAQGRLYGAGSSGSPNFRAQLSRWDGSAWSTLFTHTQNSSQFNDIVIDRFRGLLYAAGTFTDLNGDANQDNIARYDIAAGTWAALVAGTNGIVEALALEIDGTLVAAGNYTTIGGQSIPRAAAWNGHQWRPLPDPNGLGIPNLPEALEVDNDGSLYIGGSSAPYSTTPLRATGLVRLVDRTLLGVDVLQPGPLTGVDVSAIAALGERIAFVFPNSGADLISAARTTVINPGSATVTPQLLLVGPTSGTARIYHITNLTTGETTLFDLVLYAGEIIDLDLRAEPIEVTSSHRGRLSLGEITLPTSDLDLGLLAGTNDLAVFATSDEVMVLATYTPRYWSVDT